MIVILEAIFKMKLNLNDSELTTILTFLGEAINEDNVFDMQKATIKNILDKINDNVQFKHHNIVEDIVIDMREAYFEEDEE